MDTPIINALLAGGKMPWRARAKCRQLDLSREERIKLFFPMRATTNLAKATCATCPVQKECKAFADETNTMYGIWAGESRRKYDKNRDDDQ